MLNFKDIYTTSLKRFFMKTCEKNVDLGRTLVLRIILGLQHDSTRIDLCMSYKNKKTQVHFVIKMILVENECLTRVSYIPFLSKAFL